MFVFIKGQLVESSPLHVIVETNGIGYKIFISANAFTRIPQIDQPIFLHTSFVIREFSQSLYGFLTSQERDLFEALMNVSGIGPKLALSIIGHMDCFELQRSIEHHDVPSLCKIPGIGKKTAERLIIEMRDKLGSLLPPTPNDHGLQIPSDPKAQTIRDAMCALINLGYNQMTAQKAIKKTLKDIPEKEELHLPTLITTALKHI